MKTHKTSFASEPVVNEYERIATEQFAQASQDYKAYANHAGSLGKILMEAGVPPDTRTALGLIVNAVGILRASGVAPRIIMEATGGVVAASHGPLVPGGLQKNLAKIADKRAANLAHLMTAHKAHTLSMDLDDDVEGAPLTVVVQNVREGLGYRLDVSIGYHDDARDPGSPAPRITMRTALECVAAAVREGLDRTTDPKAVN